MCLRKRQPLPRHTVPVDPATTVVCHRPRAYPWVVTPRCDVRLGTRVGLWFVSGTSRLRLTRTSHTGRRRREVCRSGSYPDLNRLLCFDQTPPDRTPRPEDHGPSLGKLGAQRCGLGHAVSRRHRSDTRVPVALRLRFCPTSRPPKVAP